MADHFTPHTFTHPLLGTLTGRLPESTPSVVHFRSIPFARIPARFRQSVLITAFEDGESRDFTEYGTACPAPSQGDYRAPFGGSLPGDGERKFDEFSCLNLTISAPKDALGDEGRELPVMVYVHGGGFRVGAGHISALHDTIRLVDLSIQEGHPVVIVSIHYRLNWQGFIASQDLLDEAKANNEPAVNYGLYDQRTAFFWIHRFISGFGGNPKRISAFGESAGSGSIALHMSTSVPLFNRAILMSATTATGPPVPLEQKETEYRALLAYCGINVEDPERLSRLREIPVTKLVEAADALGILLFNSLRSEDFFTRGFPSWHTEGALIGGCDWVDEVVIGDAYFEGWIFADIVKNVPLNQFTKLTEATLGANYAGNILSAYRITPGMDHNLFLTRLMYLMGDITFSEPAHNLSGALATRSEKRVFRYTMTMRNPFPGSNLHQIPGHHFIDLLFLFGTLRERYPTQRYKDLSDEFGKRWLRFGLGIDPWDEYKIDGREDDGKLMLISGAEGWVVKTRERDEEESKHAEEGERRYAGWEALTSVMKNLSLEEGGKVQGEQLWQKWIGGIFSLMSSARPT